MSRPSRTAVPELEGIAGEGFSDRSKRLVISFCVALQLIKKEKRKPVMCVCVYVGGGGGGVGGYGMGVSLCAGFCFFFNQREKGVINTTSVLHTT